MSVHCLDPEEQRRLHELSTAGEYDVELEELQQVIRARIDEFHRMILSEHLDDAPQRRVPFLGVTPLSQVRYLGMPRQEVNLSPEAMGQAKASLDVTGEYYGTSGDADPRGYWMKLDVQSDHRDAGDTQA